MLELILEFLTFGNNKGIRVLAGIFLKQQLLGYAQNFQWVQSSVFLNEKHLFQFSMKNICSNSLVNSKNVRKCLKCDQSVYPHLTIKSET